MDSQWLKAQFELNPDKTKSGLADILGLEAPAISKILKGTRQIKAQEYLTMRKYFDLPIDGERATSNENAYKIEPLDQGGFQDNKRGDGGDWVIPAEIISSRTKASPDKIKIYQVRENMMEPDFKRGEHVLIDMSDKHPSPPGVFVVSDGFGHMIRHCEFIPKSSPPEIRISATQSGFTPQSLKKDDFEIIGRVIAKLQMI